MGREGQAVSLFITPREFFDEMVNDAFERRKVKALPFVKTYIVDLLTFYVPAANLFDETDSSGRRTRETLAETFLKAQSSEANVRKELLKKLADRALYISGFFGGSLQRKLVDVDYYADMGGMAYGALAEYTREESLAKTYTEFAKRFLEFVDVLDHIAGEAHLQSEDNLLRLFEIYARTGSELAKEKLAERGLFAVPSSGKTIKDEQ